MLSLIMFELYANEGCLKNLTEFLTEPQTLCHEVKCHVSQCPHLSDRKSEIYPLLRLQGRPGFNMWHKLWASGREVCHKNEAALVDSSSDTAQ